MQVVIIDNFRITGRGIIAQIQHNLEGLPTGTLLKSVQTGKIWEVRLRIVHAHLEGTQKIFENETTQMEFFSFTKQGAMLESVQKIMQQETESIFWYWLLPQGHEDKPSLNELCDVL